MKNIIAMTVTILVIGGWMVASFFIRRRRIRDLIPLDGHAYVGLVMLTLILIGNVMCELAYNNRAHTSSVVICVYSIGAALFTLGSAGMVGWMLAPGGSLFMYTPIFALTGYWPPRVQKDPSLKENSAYWSRWSSVLAIFCIVSYAAQFIYAWKHIWHVCQYVYPVK